MNSTPENTKDGKIVDTRMSYDGLNSHVTTLAERQTRTRADTNIEPEPADSVTEFAALKERNRPQSKSKEDAK